MISTDIPLNQGCLTPIKIKIPPHTILSPSLKAATVGSNVETSQRIVDLIFKAFQACAASQGTCTYYSTIQFEVMLTLLKATISLSAMAAQIKSVVRS